MAVETDTERAVFLDTDDFAKSATFREANYENFDKKYLQESKIAFSRYPFSSLDLFKFEKLILGCNSFFLPSILIKGFVNLSG